MFFYQKIWCIQKMRQIQTHVSFRAIGRQGDGLGLQLGRERGLGEYGPWLSGWIDVDRQPSLQTITYITRLQSQSMTTIKKINAQPSAPCLDIFELTPIDSNPNSYYKEVKVEFFGSPEKSRLSKTSKFRWPKFNNDGLFFTPAFIIPEDQAVLSLVQNSLKNDYMNRMKTNDEPETKDTLASLAQPEPQEQKHCGVCKTSYESFQKHINSIGHKENCKKSKYTKHIYDFCEEIFGDQAPKQEYSSKGLQPTRNPCTRKNPDPELSMPWPFETPSTDALSPDSMIDTHYPHHLNQYFPICNMDISPPVKRRKFH